MAKRKPVSELLAGIKQKRAEIAFKRDAAEKEDARIQKKIKSLPAPDLRKKLFEHTVRERVLTAIRREEISVNVPLRASWIAIQETRSGYFIRLVRAELKYRIESTSIAGFDQGEELIKQRDAIVKKMKTIKAS
jgi:hypothetical protein